MFLFQDVDPEQTEQNVIDFFNRKYERICVMAGLDLKSPIISNSPVSTSNVNSKESQVTGVLEARELLDVIRKSILACSADSQILIQQKLIAHNKSVYVMNSMHINSNDRYYAIRSKACNQFADAFQVRAEALIGSEADLHEYKNRKSIGN